MRSHREKQKKQKNAKRMISEKRKVKELFVSNEK